MNHGPDIVDETTRAALPRAARRDRWIEQRLNYLAAEQARLKGAVAIRRFLWGAVAAYRRFLFTADPAHRFHCWGTIHAVSAGLEQMERAEVGHEGSGAAPDGPDLERSLRAGWTDRPH